MSFVFLPRMNDERKRMIRGWYTGASGMAAQQVRLDAIANNLANVDTDGFKKDIAVHKAFPELLLRRMNDDGVIIHPFGSSDLAPVVGKIGLGVEMNELFTEFSQGSLKETESDFDIALDGQGFLSITTPYGERYTRNGSFTLGKEGYLETKEGYPVLGENGPIKLKANNFKIDAQGRIFVNQALQDDPNRLVSKEDNSWEDTVLLDTLKVVGFEKPRFLQKQGSSMYASNFESGDAKILERGEKPKVVQGFVESANVNPVTEMVQMIEVNRAYEANQKTIQTEDSTLGKLINEVVKV
jgi:flagellar basal-body rod protein FlgF